MNLICLDRITSEVTGIPLAYQEKLSSNPLLEGVNWQDVHLSSVRDLRNKNNKICRSCSGVALQG